MKNFIYSLSIFLFISSNLFSKEIEILSDVLGEGVEIKNHYKVHVNYRGTLEDGTEFDNSFKRNKPLVFQIGLRQVILGWEKGLMGMKVGGKRIIKIPPELGYGSRGAGELIPPNAILIFEVEIVNAFEPGYHNLYPDELIDKQKKGLILIDIRNEKERKDTGVIDGSLKITAFDLKGNFHPNFIKTYQAAVSKSDHVVLISSKGEISAILANGFVEQLGSTNMYTLVGGIENWLNEDRRLIK
jgi:rhodanese-related sulfurtransferase